MAARKKKLIIILPGLFVGTVLAVVLWPGEREPEYQGKKLSEWIRVYQQGQSIQMEGVRVSSSMAAVEALQHMGTNALPWLIRWMSYEPAPLKQRLIISARKARMNRVGDLLSKKEALGFFAVDMFRLLGSNGAPVAPELMRLAMDSQKRLSSQQAMQALTYVGNDGFQALLAILEDNAAPGRLKVPYYIMQMHSKGFDIRPAVPALLRTDSEIERRVAARPGPADPFYATAFFKDRPAFFIPSLTNCVRHSDPIVRREAARILGFMRNRGMDAVPALLSSLSDPDPTVREASTNALREIAPEVLTNGVSGALGGMD